ncbi:PREDICTED: induced myeloid leukemia cell differentiation protein Mcl-1 isoform X2 [Haliaeetus leucocephalus]|uniref:induced myeloid leukemia cell differentiation protein Mcl-1 isoform X2 n=1 Tax=Haliaeetus leucocephalus TaxID=52644 RepID=UPI00053CB5A2|nr:PREDICTED: induced myeloid leukemia cell differentiation protein Mcl-1 isoform X2 [Haliaeetus leucocephalus]
MPASKPTSLAGMLRKLEIQKEEDLQSVCEVAAHVFSDGVTNWGRVVTLISFGAFVAKHLKSINQERCISSLAGIITDALVSSKREWLMSQGGWEGFVDFFRVEDLEGSIRNVLMAFAGVAGLGASLAYMIRKVTKCWIPNLGWQGTEFCSSWGRCRRPGRHIPGVLIPSSFPPLSSSPCPC